MKQKLMATVITGALILSAFSSTSFAEENVTLRFSWWGGDDRLAATLAVIDAFEEKYPNITIEAEYGSSDGYHDKLSTALAGGTAADIVQVDPEIMPTYVDLNPEYFINFDEYNFDFSNFDETFLRSEICGYYDGRQLGIPTGLTSRTLLVNQDLANAIGIDFSQKYDWNDLIEWGKMVRQYDDSLYLLSTNKTYLATFVFWSYAKQLTGKTLFNVDTGELNITEEELAKSFAYIKSLYDNEVIAPASYAANYDGDTLQSDPNWISGKYVATLAFISTMEVMTAANPDPNYSIGELPIMDNALDDGWPATTCPQIIAVTSTCKHPEEAMLFLDYFFNDEDSMSTLACTRSVPPTEKAREICEENGTLNSLVKDASDLALSYTGILPDKYASSQEGKQILIDLIELVGYGEYTPEQAASDAVTQLQRLTE